MSWASGNGVSPSVARQCGAGLGAAWFGTARIGKARAADSSTGGFGSHCCSLWRADIARHGVARRVAAWQDRVWRGVATADDLSTEGASPPCWVHLTHSKV